MEVTIQTRYTRKELLLEAIKNFLQSESATNFLQNYPYSKHARILKFFKTKKTLEEIDQFCKYFAKEMYLKNVKIEIPKKAKEKELAKLILCSLFKQYEIKKHLIHNKVIALNFDQIIQLNFNLNKLLYEIEKYGLSVSLLFKNNYGLSLKRNLTKWTNTQYQ